MGCKKKGTIAAVVSVILVAVVVAVAVTTTSKSGGGGRHDVTSATKAVAAICNPTQYKATCQSSLSGANTTDPKKLIGTAISVTVKSIAGVLKASAVLERATDDRMTRGAYAVCRDVLGKSIYDLRRSVGKVGAYEPAKARQYVADLRTWLSAVVANHETCIDAFKITAGAGAGEKMREMLQYARELSSNGLAMVTDLSEFVGAAHPGSRKLAAKEGLGFFSRRLAQTATLALKPTIVVAKDGSGQFKTINDAINSLPKTNNGSFIVIHIKAGVYDEYVEIPKGLNKIVFIGDGPNATKLTGNRSVAGGHQTFHTATLSICGDEFLAKDIGVENTAGPGSQALAVKVSSDGGILYNVHMHGYQDTLCADTYRQFYKNCTVSGTVDYVFGDAAALFQDCTFVMRKPVRMQDTVVTAQGRSDIKSIGAFVIQNCHFTAEEAFLAARPKFPAYLGRPWKELSRTIIMQSEINDFIDPAGWTPWIGTYGQDTCYYAEYGNRGAGADTSGRVKWKCVRRNLTAEQVQSWTGGVMFSGPFIGTSGGDEWIKESGVPYVPTMMQV